MTCLYCGVEGCSVFSGFMGFLVQNVGLVSNVVFTLQDVSVELNRQNNQTQLNYYPPQQLSAFKVHAEGRLHTQSLNSASEFSVSEGFYQLMVTTYLTEFCRCSKAKQRFNASLSNFLQKTVSNTQSLLSDSLRGRSNRVVNRDFLLHEDEPSTVLKRVILQLLQHALRIARVNS